MQAEIVKYVPTLDLPALTQVDKGFRDLCKDDLHRWIHTELRRLIGPYEMLLGLLKVSQI